MNVEELRKICGTTDPFSLKMQAGHVRRYHQEGLKINQDVAQHSWRVCLIILHLWPGACKTLLKAALEHDIPERYIGDISAPAKRVLNADGQLDDIEREFCDHVGISFDKDLDKLNYTRLKCADYLELCDTAVQNDRPRVWENGVDYINKLVPFLPADERERVMALLGRILGCLPRAMDMTGQDNPFGFQPELELS